MAPHFVRASFMFLFPNRTSARLACCGLLFAGIGVAAHAQNGPLPSGGWLPLTQQELVSDDPFDGNPPYVPYLDIVADKAAAPAAFVSSDVDYLYFRLRVAASPYRSGGFNRFYSALWACLLDLDQDPQTYELLTGINGIASPQTVDIDQNTATGTPDDIGDPAETQLKTYDASIGGVNARYLPAGSALGGGTDYFIEWNVSWTDLLSAGFPNTMPFRLVCGTSTGATSLNGDVLDGGSGSKSLSADMSDSLLCDDSGCRYYDPLFKDGFEGP
jgi:hypothetical protein